MSARSGRRYSSVIHPLPAVLLAGMVPLFLGALLSDIAYASSYHVQWINFASWLIAGALVFGGCALLWALIELLRSDRRGRRRILYFVVLLATWLLGLFNAFIHGKDAWGSMPEGLILSAIVTAFAIWATWIGFSSLRTGAVE